MPACVSAVRATRAGRGASLLDGLLGRSFGVTRAVIEGCRPPQGEERRRGSLGLGCHGEQDRVGVAWTGSGPRDEQTRLSWGPGTPGGAREGREWRLGPAAGPQSPADRL